MCPKHQETDNSPITRIYPHRNHTQKNSIDFNHLFGFWNFICERRELVFCEQSPETLSVHPHPNVVGAILCFPWRYLFFGEFSIRVFYRRIVIMQQVEAHPVIP